MNTTFSPSASAPYVPRAVEPDETIIAPLLQRNEEDANAHLETGGFLSLKVDVPDRSWRARLGRMASAVWAPDHRGIVMLLGGGVLLIGASGAALMIIRQDVRLAGSVAGLGSAWVAGVSFFCKRRMDAMKAAALSA